MEINRKAFLIPAILVGVAGVLSGMVLLRAIEDLEDLAENSCQSSFTELVDISRRCDDMGGLLVVHSVRKTENGYQLDGDCLVPEAEKGGEILLQ